MTTEGTTDTALVARPEAPELTPYEVIERVIASGDLSRMDAPARVAFYWRTCESLGLNPLTRPFEFIVLDGKMTLYARKDATDQLRWLNRVSVTQLRSELNDSLGLFTVYARGRTADGREEESTGVVSVKGVQGQALANLFMKAETKAKRRLTLSLVGLGFLDESEVEGAGAVTVNPNTGEITAPTTTPSLLETVQAQTYTLAADTPSTVFVQEPEVEHVERVEAEPEPARTATNPVEHVERVEAEPEPARTATNALTLVEFSEKLSASGLNRDKVRAQVKLLYPEVTRFGELTPEQLGTVWDTIAPVTPQATPEAPGEPIELLAAPMSTEASAAVTAVCGAPSPYGDSVCLLGPDHKGTHRASADEAW